MSDFINEDIIDFDNDASASSFGWNFQVNAGIFLFLHYIEAANSLKIESKLQDVEIKLKDKKILAQAKSAQDPSLDKGKKEKFKDALISIAKSSGSEPKAQFIYISNESDTFSSADKAFDNKICSYSECLQSIKDEIDETIQSTIDSLSRKINRASKKTECDKLKKYKKLIERLDKDNLYFSCIPRFWGNEENRYTTIKDKIDCFLLNTLNLDSIIVKKISNRLFEHWVFKCEHNSTEKDISKEIKKEEFLWPISVFLLQDINRDINDCLNFLLDTSLEDEVDSIFKDNSMLYHERFEFSNKVLQDYNDFRKIIPIGTKDPEKKFIKELWENYTSEFLQENFDSEKLEYVTKSFIYRILINSRNLRTICPKVGLNK